jgi:hypothetical protein
MAAWEGEVGSGVVTASAADSRCFLRTNQKASIPSNASPPSTPPTAPPITAALFLEPELAANTSAAAVVCVLEGGVGVGGAGSGVYEEILRI